MAVGNTILHDVCSELDFGEIATVTRLINVLDDHSKVLAVDEEFRASMGEKEPSVWPDMRRLWVTITAAHSSLSSEDEDSGQEATLRGLCISLARFTRNLVAAVPYNQERAFENEPSIRELTRYYTSYLVLQDPKSLSATRMLAQCLCNLVTANEALMQRLWDSYLGLPEEQLILTRLLSVPDIVTTTATFVLILNCLHGSDHRTSRLTSTSNGSRLCTTLLDRMVALFDGPEAPDGTSAFDIGYNVFRKIVEAGAVPAVYARIAVDGEVVSPHQTTALKLLDSYLQPSQSRPLTLDSGILRGLCEFLSREFFSLSTYSQLAIARALGPHHTRRQSPVREQDDVPQSSDTAAEGSNSSAPADALQELDLLLPKVCEALVLVTQCLTSLCLISEESAIASSTLPPTQENPPSNMRADGHLKDIVSSAVSPLDEGLVENLIETLRQLDLFLPRITLGMVAPTAVPVSKAQESARKLQEEAHAQDSAGIARSSDPKGFSYLKRDLVRLLGILSSDRRTVQDRVRACGGIQVVMNLCVVDDRNPYLREHAIFALRNLLHGNNENQMLVNDIQPVAEWDDNGMLRR